MAEFIIDELTEEDGTRSTSSNTTFLLDGAPGGRLPISSMRRRDGTPIQTEDRIPVTISAEGGRFVTATATVSLTAPQSITVIESTIRRSSADGSMPTFDAGQSVRIKVVLTGHHAVAVDDEGKPTRPELFRSGAIIKTSDEFEGESGSVDGEAVVVLGGQELVDGVALTARKAREADDAGLFVQDDAATAAADGRDVLASATGRKVRVGIKAGVTDTAQSIPAGTVLELFPTLPKTRCTYHVDVTAKDGSAKATAVIDFLDPPEAGAAAVVGTGHVLHEEGSFAFVDSAATPQVRNLSDAGIPVDVTKTRIR